MGVGVIVIHSKSNLFSLIIENCTFHNNVNSVLYFDVLNQIVFKNDYSVIVNNCEFMYKNFL